MNKTVKMTAIALGAALMIGPAMSQTTLERLQKEAGPEATASAAQIKPVHAVLVSGGRRRKARRARGYEWLIGSDGDTHCFAIDDPEGALAVNPQHCHDIADGFEWQTGQDGYYRCYAIADPENAPSVNEKYCKGEKPQERRPAGPPISPADCLNEATSIGEWRPYVTGSDQESGSGASSGSCFTHELSMGQARRLCRGAFDGAPLRCYRKVMAEQGHWATCVGDNGVGSCFTHDMSPAQAVDFCAP